MAARPVVRGTNKNDRLILSSPADVYGLGGADLIQGSWGGDVIDGGAGGDLVFGMGGDDVIVHSLGQGPDIHDRYNGGEGTDRLRVIGGWSDYLSAPLQALAGLKASGFTLGSMPVVSAEAVEFQFPSGRTVDLTRDEPVKPGRDMLSVRAGGSARVALLSNDEIPDMVRSVTLMTPMPGLSLQVRLDPFAPGGQQAVLSYAPGKGFHGLGPEQIARRQVMVQIIDADGDRAMAPVTLAIKGRAQSPGVISGATSGSIIEDQAPFRIGGTLTVADVNPGESRLRMPAAEALRGEYGLFALAPQTGAWSYTADRSKLQSLAEGQRVTETLKLVSADGLASRTLSVRLEGRDDPTRITDAAGTVGEDQTQPLQKVLTVMDLDRGEAGVQDFASPVAGRFGSFTLQDLGEGKAAWSYLPSSSLAAVQALGPGETLNDGAAFYTATGAVSALSVQITGVNDAPTGRLALSGDLAAGSTVSVAKGSLADAEGLGALSFQWLRDGKAIPGATGADYRLAEADISAQIAVRASYTDGKGTAESTVTEFGRAATFMVTTLQDVVDAGDGVTSLREAIAGAAARPGADVIRFAEGMEGVIHLQHSQLEVLEDNDLSIYGAGRITIDANADGNKAVETVAPTTGSGRALYISNADVTLVGLGFTGGRADGRSAEIKNGGAIHTLITSNVTVANCWFVANRAAELGGAISFDDRGGCTLTVTASRFDGNIAGNGGAISVGGSHGSDTLVVRESSFSNNSAVYGAAVEGTGQFFASKFFNNVARDDSGLIGDAGAIHFLLSGGIVRDSQFVGNKASKFGGAIGGGVGIGWRNIDVSNSYFAFNSAEYGGAIWRANVTTSTFFGNSGVYGGALLMGTASQSTFYGNDASEKGTEIDGSEVRSSLLLSQTDEEVLSPFAGNSDLGGNIMLGRDIDGPLDVLASLELDTSTAVPHLRLRADRDNPALDRIEDATGPDALGQRPVDLEGIGDAGRARDVGAVELLSLIA